jgi:hypothetical protein
MANNVSFSRINDTQYLAEIEGRKPLVLSLNDIRNWKASLLRLQPNTDSTIDFILSTVCNGFALSETKIFSDTRETSVIKPRQIFFYLMRKYSKNGMTLSKIGAIPALHGGKGFDHSTVLHAYNTVKKMKEVGRNGKDLDPVAKPIVNYLETVVAQKVKPVDNVYGYIQSAYFDSDRIIFSKTDTDK